MPKPSHRYLPSFARGLRDGLIFIVLALIGAVLAAAAIPGAAHAAAPQAIAQGVPPTLDDFRRVLNQYGGYIYSERYGDVWRPTTLPPGWHPYPACNWVYDRTYGWMYDDATPWGRIVHHYGRWAHDADAGWVWVPGIEWSPAWVIWRTGGPWTGWAPTPPAGDQQETTVAAFESDKQWTFIETEKLANRCTAEPAPAPAAAFRATTLVTTVKIVRNIAVFAVEPPPGTAAVDVDPGPVAPWPAAFLGDWITLLGAVSSGAPITLANAALCPAPAADPRAIVSQPPPAPRRARPQALRETRALPDPPPPLRVGPRPPPVEGIPQGIVRGPVIVPDVRPPRPWPPRVQGPAAGPGGGFRPPRPHRPGDLQPLPGGRPVLQPPPGSSRLPPGRPRRPLPIEGGPVIR